MPPNRLSPATLADLMREVGIAPPAHALYTDSVRRPIPRTDAYVPMRDVQLSQRQQQQSFSQLSQRQRIQGELQRREAYDPGIDPNTGMTQAQEALLYNLEPTGVPSLFRSYNSFQEGRPLEGAGHGALGLLGTLGTASMAAMPARRTAAQMGRLPLNGALEPPTRLPVNPTREIAPNGLPIRPSEPFRTSLNGGSDDLLAAARQRPDAGVAGAEQVGRETALARRENDYMPRGANGDVTATDSYPFGFNRAGPFATQEPTVRLDQFMATDREGSIPYLPALNAAAEAAKKNPPLSQRVRLSNLTATQSVVESNFLNPGRAGQPDAPVVVVQAGGRLWVADGHHRIAAAIARGETDVPALVFGERGHPIELPDGGARRLVTDRAAGSQSSGLAPTAPTASPGPKPTDQKNQTPPRKRGFPFGRAR